MITAAWCDPILIREKIAGRRAHFDGARMPYAVFSGGGYAMHQGICSTFRRIARLHSLPKDGQAVFENAPVGTPWCERVRSWLLIKVAPAKLCTEISPAKIWGSFFYRGVINRAFHDNQRRASAARSGCFLGLAAFINPHWGNSGGWGINPGALHQILSCSRLVLIPLANALRRDTRASLSGCARASPAANFVLEKFAGAGGEASSA